MAEKVEGVTVQCTGRDWHAGAPWQWQRSPLAWSSIEQRHCFTVLGHINIMNVRRLYLVNRVSGTPLRCYWRFLLRCWGQGEATHRQPVHDRRLHCVHHIPMTAQIHGKATVCFHTWHTWLAGRFHRAGSHSVVFYCWFPAYSEDTDSPAQWVMRARSHRHHLPRPSKMKHGNSRSKRRRIYMD